MHGLVVAAGTLPSFEFRSIKYGGEVLHRIRVTGRIDLERRMPLYHETLANNPSSNYFCILDNSEGHENDLSLSDIMLLDKILVEAGIEKFYGATITPDWNYKGIVKLANFSAEVSKLNAELLSTRNPDEAESFIMGFLEESRG